MDRLDGNSLGWNQAINMLIPIWIGSELLVMLTNKKRRALHDFIAGTVVIKKTFVVQ